MSCLKLLIKELFILLKMQWKVCLSCYLLFYLFISFSVFWDLYCAAPERRDTCDHSSEAKAFHDYVSTES